MSINYDNLVYVEHPGLYEITRNDDGTTAFRKIYKRPVKYEKVVINKDGEEVDLKVKKHEHSFNEILKLIENDVERKVLVISQNDVIDNDDMPTVLIEIWKGKSKECRFKLSNTQTWQLIEAIQEYYSYGKDGKHVVYADEFGNEVKVLIALLRSYNGLITRKDLEKMGMSKSTTWAVIQGLIKRGILEVSHKPGRFKVYKCTIPKDKLREMFIGKEGDE